MLNAVECVVCVCGGGLERKGESCARRTVLTDAHGGLDGRMDDGGAIERPEKKRRPKKNKSPVDSILRSRVCSSGTFQCVCVHDVVSKLCPSP